MNENVQLKSAKNTASRIEKILKSSNSISSESTTTFYNNEGIVTPKSTDINDLLKTEFSKKVHFDNEFLNGEPQTRKRRHHRRK